jgi:hypothetical protein
MSTKLKYTIANKSFRTKDELKKQCQDILAKGNPVDKKDIAFVLELFSHHGWWVEEVSSHGTAKGVHTGQSVHGTTGFFIEFADGEKVNMSFINAVRAFNSNLTTEEKQARVHRGNVIGALRHAIAPQIREFRKSVFLKPTDTIVCPITGEKIHQGLAHIDHKGKEFRELLKEFLSNEGIADESNVSMAGYNISDSDLVDRWKNYHLQHAELQALSIDGHKKKK